MIKYYLTLTVFIILHMALLAQDIPEEGATIDTIDTNVDLFNELDPLKFTLTLDLKEFQRNKNDGEYVPVHFQYRINDTLSLEKSMRMKARGEFRRGYCSYAPFWLNIREAQVGNKYLQDVKRIKIVTHCYNSKPSNEYVLKEYLAYKIFNILSPYSFRVRLIRMNYVDTGRKNKVTESWAFMIEPEEMLAARHNAQVIKKDELSMKFMETEAMDLVAMFQYMIGNPDYSVAGRHNLKILGLEGFGSKGYTPVPYDFDYTGIVNAAYAIPGDNLGITSVTERYFMGPCREDQDYIRAMDHIEKHHHEIMEFIHSFAYMDEDLKSEVIGYLESYFSSAKAPDFIKSKLKKTCR